MSKSKITPASHEVPGSSNPSRKRSQFVPVGESKTQQQFKASVDVNNIVRHYAQTGIDPYESRKQQQRFGSVPNKSYTEAMFHVAEVQSAFHTLPASDRAAFQNDPQRWIDHLQYSAPAQPEIIAPEPVQSVSRDPAVEPTAKPALTDNLSTGT